MKISAIALKFSGMTKKLLNINFKSFRTKIMEEEPFLISMAKLTIVLSLIVGSGAVLGMIGYFWMMSKGGIMNL